MKRGTPDGVEEMHALQKKRLDTAKSNLIPRQSRAKVEIRHTTMHSGYLETVASSVMLRAEVLVAKMVLPSKMLPPKPARKSVQSQPSTYSKKMKLVLL